jgi:S-adenosylmethionine hydrolase
VARPVIAILTDFGLHDHYVGTLKAVALGICPEVAFLDISHDIAPHDVADAAFQLGACYHFFPAGTVFLVIVDPGVGSARRGIALETADHRFVAPDNGVLSVVLAEGGARRVVELTDRRFFRPTVSRTFEGRDRFAPAAAWLARGVAVSALGRPCTDPLVLDLPHAESTSERIEGAVVRVDRFGNLITNIDRRQFERLAGSRPVEIVLEDRAIARLVATYPELAPGEVGALFGSNETLELAMASASAAKATGLGRGARVYVTRTGD